MAKNLKQVLDQIDKLQRVADALRSKEVDEVVERIKVAIAHYNLTPEMLFGGAAKRGPSQAQRLQTPKRGGQPKYRSDDGRTWSGVGKRPAWFVEALASGRTAETLLVDANADAQVRKRRGKKMAAKAPADSSSVKLRNAGAPKYGDATGKTWTGRGKRPAWFVQAIDSGKAAEDLLLKQS